ncbi:MAG: aminotransferase class I/II-fold pyridoxal phosphate-dependent enzyme, partial [Prevotella sp.]|nr:aminotransferase class I/II-fold pyridoxal phosphate-dependent enzyme [Prevotella sp.]
MKYNFDEIVTRRGSNCVKWDEADDPDILPLWVADLDFHVYPALTEALHKRVEHGVFGYAHVPQSYYDSVLNWFRDRHGVKGWKREHMIYTIGVVPAISAIIHALTLPGDKVLICTPVYNCFFSSIRNQGCIAEEVPLLLSESQTSPAFTVDWEAFEKVCCDPKVRIFLLCNPHNPAGRVWTREELQRMGEICFRNNVFVISDE